MRAVDDGFIVAWHDHRDGNAEIYARVLDERGRPRGPSRRLTHTETLSFEAHLDVVDGDQGDLIVAWYERVTPQRSEARIGRWTRAGEERWQATVSAAGRHGRNPVARVTADRLFCAWLQGTGEETSVLIRWFDLAGQSLSPPRRVAAAGPATWNLNATPTEDGDVWVVFDATAGTRSDEIFLVRVSEENDAVVRLTLDDGVSSKYPDVALSSPW